MATLIPTVTAVKAHLVEIFSSFQGEGPWVGERQLFVRFLGCHLDCAYCDAPDTKRKQSHCKIETHPGTWNFETKPNPFTSQELLDEVLKFGPPTGYHALAVTGGEPLLHHRFLLKWLPMVRQAGHRIYLETSGDLTDRLKPVAHLMDFCSMDVKLTSTTGEKPLWAEHRAFLQILREFEVRTFVKAVVGHNTTDEEITETAQLVRDVWPDIPMIIQPVTPFGRVTQSVGPERLLRMQELALQITPRVRIIPQTHKMVGVL